MTDHVVRHIGGATIATCDDAQTAYALSKAMGPQFDSMVSITFAGVPFINAITRDDGAVYGLFVHEAVADRACEYLNKTTPGKFAVGKIMLNYNDPTNVEYEMQAEGYDAVVLCARTEDAYSAVDFKDGEWLEACYMLLKRDYSMAQAEGILRSKWTRWCRDSYSEEGEGRAKYLAQFLDDPKNNCTIREVNSFVEES